MAGAPVTTAEWRTVVPSGASTLTRQVVVVAPPVVVVFRQARSWASAGKTVSVPVRPHVPPRPTRTSGAVDGAANRLSTRTRTRRVGLVVDRVAPLK